MKRARSRFLLDHPFLERFFVRQFDLIEVFYDFWNELLIDLRKVRQESIIHVDLTASTLNGNILRT